MYILNKFDEIIKRYANLINTLILLAAFLMFNFAVFPFFQPKDSSFKPLDLQYLYTSEQAYETLDKLSNAERKNYLIAECTVDVLYPLIYTLLLCFSIYLIYRNLTLAKLPLFILITDYVENIGIIQILRKFPEQWTVLANFTGVVSAVKWLLALLVVILVIGGLFNLIRKTMFGS